MSGWINLATTFPRHPKALAAGPVARHLFIVGLCWAGEYDTDGAIPGYALNSLAIDAGIPNDDVGQVADRLVEVGLWVRQPDGWQVHDWGQWQSTSAEREERRSKNRERQRAWRDRQLAKAAEEDAARNDVTETSRDAERHADGAAADDGLLAPDGNGTTYTDDAPFNDVTNASRNALVTAPKSKSKSTPKDLSTSLLVPSLGTAFGSETDGSIRTATTDQRIAATFDAWLSRQAATQGIPEGKRRQGYIQQAQRTIDQHWPALKALAKANPTATPDELADLYRRKP